MLLEFARIVVSSSEEIEHPVIINNVIISKILNVIVHIKRAFLMIKFLTPYLLWTVFGNPVHWPNDIQTYSGAITEP